VTTRSETRIAKKYRVLGRVQGVGFRYFADRAARQLGLCGYVRNCPEGSVEAYAIGEPAKLERFKLLLAQGPRSAQVIKVEESDESVSFRYTDFVIEGGW
jgi:acylphosphatase